MIILLGTTNLFIQTFIYRIWDDSLRPGGGGLSIGVRVFLIFPKILSFGLGELRTWGPTKLTIIKIPGAKRETI